jgi:membrane-associated phospholipid phosphatase
MYFKRQNEFEKSNFQLIASSYIFYFIFSIFPSAGPQFYFNPPQNILPDAFVFDKVMHFIQQTAEQPTGAFPSSHVGISVIILLIARTKAPAFYKYAWPLVLLIMMSTVYIKAHYVVDVIGGLFIAPFILYLSTILSQVDIKNSIKRP